MSCVDTLKNIRNARKIMQASPWYYHVYGYIYDYRREHNQTTENILTKDVILL